MFLVKGGRNETSAIDVVDIFHAVSSSWSVVYLSQPRYQLAATVVSTVGGSVVLFISGRTLSPSTSSSHLTLIDMYNLTTMTWSISHLSEGKSAQSATTNQAGNIVFVYSGVMQNNITSNRIETFDFAGGLFLLSYV
jgi:hypothetical protein